MRIAERLRDVLESPYLTDGYQWYSIPLPADGDRAVVVTLLASSVGAADRAARVGLPVEPSSGLLDAVAFRSWLAKLADIHFVGQGCSPVSCPLAQWLTSVCGVSFFVDVDYFAFLDSLVGTFPLPAWACRFQTQCDAQFGFDQSVPASAALLILDAVLTVDKQEVK